MPFSHRTAWPAGTNAITEAVERRRAAGLPLIDLTETNPTRVGLTPIEVPLTAGGYAPDPFGLMAAREAIVEYHQKRVEPEHVCLTASTSEAYSWLFKLLCDPGDRVLVPTPSYPLFEHLAQLEGVTLTPYATRPWDDWTIDFDALAAGIDERTRAIILVSPNNPTGAMLHRGDYDLLMRLCERHSLAIICDEVFADYTWGKPDRVPSLAGLHAEFPVFVLSGLSKVCLQPQLKVGWILAHGPPEVRRRLELIADTFLSVNTPAQRAVPELLARRDEIQAPLKARLRANLRTLATQLEGTAASLLLPDGGWSAVVKIPRTHSEERWVLGLIEAGVLVHPGFFFDFAEEGWLILSLIPEPGVFQAGVDVLRTVLNRGDL